jgi:hypothetical protein
MQEVNLIKVGDEYEAAKQVHLNLGINNHISEQGLLLDKVDHMPKRRRMTLKIKTKDQR